MTVITVQPVYIYNAFVCVDGVKTKKSTPP